MTDPGPEDDLGPGDISRFDFDLPDDRIAQEPLPHRADSRLLVVDRRAGSITEVPFAAIVDLLGPGDVLVRNDTRVIRARVDGVRLPDRARFEALLFAEPAPGRWRALVRPARKLGHGAAVMVEETLPASVEVSTHPALPGERLFVFDRSADVRGVMRARGEMPVPPYVKRFTGDPERYQTAYAAVEGAVAAPTAGFHFTPEIFRRLSGRGVSIVNVTLHVGPGTFTPVRDLDYTRHRMLAESYSVSAEASREVALARAQGRRVVAVGSTSLRVLESMARDGHLGVAASGSTDLYLYPGARFQVVDALVTNFHLPRTTLILLVAAFLGEDLLRRAYRRAVDDGFRFYSFGDAMLIL